MSGDRPEPPSAVALLRKFMGFYATLAVHFRPSTERDQNPHADDKAFRFWSERAVDAAKALAPFEAPRLGAVPYQPEPLHHEQLVAAKAEKTLNLEKMTDEELIRNYRSRISGASPLAVIEHVVEPTTRSAEEPTSMPVPSNAPSDDPEDAVEATQNVVDTANVVPLVRVPEGQEAA
jgi:hypothetical protein